MIEPILAVQQLKRLYKHIESDPEGLAQLHSWTTLAVLCNSLKHGPATERFSGGSASRFKELIERVERNAESMVRLRSAEADVADADNALMLLEQGLSGQESQ